MNHLEIIFTTLKSEISKKARNNGPLAGITFNDSCGVEKLGGETSIGVYSINLIPAVGKLVLKITRDDPQIEELKTIISEVIGNGEVVSLSNHNKEDVYYG